MATRSTDGEVFNTAAAALKKWAKLDRDDVARVLNAVELLETRLGQHYEATIRESGDAIGVRFSAARQAGTSYAIYVTPGYIDVIPAAVADFGGLDALQATSPGFHHPLGQRFDHARLLLRGYRPRSDAAPKRAGEYVEHHGLSRRVGSTCDVCDEIVTSVLSN